MNVQGTSPLIATLRTVINKVFVRTYFKKPFSYTPRYYGLFDYHDKEKYPTMIGNTQEEELLEEIRAIKNKVIDSPSPFHVVRRTRMGQRLNWVHRVTLRRLNLHSNEIGDVVVVPNTPQFNKMLNDVKHLITVKPAIFIDGKIPKEEDIGAIKVCPYTGKITVDEKLRMQQSRLKTDRPFIFKGRNLRYMINRTYGVCDNTYIKAMSHI